MTTSYLYLYVCVDCYVCLGVFVNCVCVFILIVLKISSVVSSLNEDDFTKHV